MQTAQPNPLMRDDTMFGVCQAIGDDFGFNPTILRAAFAIPLVWNPLLAAGIYVTLAVAVLVSRIVIREPRQPQPASVPAAAPEALTADNETEVLAEAA
jgi:phage shock protein C